MSQTNKRLDLSTCCLFEVKSWQQNMMVDDMAEHIKNFSTQCILHINQQGIINKVIQKNLK